MSFSNLWSSVKTLCCEHAQSHFLQAKLNISGADSVYKCLCPAGAQIFPCPATWPEPSESWAWGNMAGLRACFFLAWNRKKIKPLGFRQALVTKAGRLHTVILALSNHKSFSEPLIHFTKQASSNWQNRGEENGREKHLSWKISCKYCCCQGFLTMHACAH